MYHVVARCIKCLTWSHTWQLASPWYEPLAIICTAAVGCAMPPTDTEKQMFKEVKQDWTAIVQRVSVSFACRGVPRH